jgi:hypothetical protein
MQGSGQTGFRRCGDICSNYLLSGFYRHITLTAITGKENVSEDQRDFEFVIQKKLGYINSIPDGMLRNKTIQVI